MFLAYYAASAAVATAMLNDASAFVPSRPIAIRQGIVTSIAAQSASTLQPFCVRRPTTHDNYRQRAVEARSTSAGLSRHVSRRVVMSADPGQGKFVRMGGAEDTQSFGPRY